MVNRLSQVLKYGWQHSGEMAAKHSESAFVRVRIFVDIIHCFYKYKMWSNQYLKEDFWYMDEGSRKTVGQKYLEAGKERDEWQKDFRNTRNFLIKYSDIKYERAGLREKRNRAYTKYYNAGPGLMVENNVNISRQHYLNGSISIGKNVLFAKNVFIDYSGEVIISDNVKFSNGAIVESHTHDAFSDPRADERIAIPKKVAFQDHVKVGSGVVILDSCASIGRNAVIGSGAVVRSSVPPYSLIIGNPAKVIGFTLTPDEIVEYEKVHYTEEERLPLELLEKNYNKYFISRIKEIKEFTRLSL